MKLIRRQNADLWNWSPVEQLSTLREEINRLFDSPFGELTRRTDLFNGWTPALDLYEDTDNLIVKAELPGTKREEIDISVHDGTLTISGERKYEEKNRMKLLYSILRLTAMDLPAKNGNWRSIFLK